MKKYACWLAVAVCLVSISAHAEVKVGNWKSLYVGIDEAIVTTDGRHASVAYAMRIDLKAPGIHVEGSPHAGTKATVSETAKDFAEQQHLQLAINAGFFQPCCEEVAQDKDILGLMISDGKLISPPSKDPNYQDALMITQNNAAIIAPVTSATDLSKISTAVTGSAIIETNGVNTGNLNSYNKGAYGNPRTLVGISRDGRYLYMVVVDGRRPGYSFGTSNTESAEIMIALGAYNALNLDGGGSTTMVRENEKGKIITVNRPSGNVDRMVAASLGVHAQPLAK